MAMDCHTHRVLLIVKPGFRRHIASILQMIDTVFRGEWFDPQIDIPRPVRLSREQVQEIWGGARKAMGDQLWEEMAEYLLSGEVQPIILDAPYGHLLSPPREEFPAAMRRLVGPTDPRRGGPDTLRGRFAEIPPASPTYYRNVLHAATEPEEVEANLKTLRLAREWRYQGEEQD